MVGGGPAGLAAALRRALRRELRLRPFLEALFRPAAQQCAPADDATLVCRCEEVTAGGIRKAAALGAPGPNQLKAFTRCGMGPCQGRMCGLPIAELLAAQRAVSPTELDTYRVRSPVKPVRLGELAGLVGVDRAPTRSTEMPTSMDAANR